MGAITLPASACSVRPRTSKLTGKHAHPGRPAGHERLASELTLARASGRPVAAALKATITTRPVVPAGQSIATGWMIGATRLAVRPGEAAVVNVVTEQVTGVGDGAGDRRSTHDSESRDRPECEFVERFGASEVAWIAGVRGCQLAATQGVLAKEVSERGVLEGVAPFSGVSAPVGLASLMLGSAEGRAVTRCHRCTR